VYMKDYLIELISSMFWIVWFVWMSDTEIILNVYVWLGIILFVGWYFSTDKKIPVTVQIAVWLCFFILDILFRW